MKKYIYIFNKDKVKKNQFLEPEISIHEDLNEVKERRINSIFVNRKFNPNIEVQKRTNVFSADFDEKFKPYKCSKCRFSFEFNQELIAHNESVHEGDKPFKCDICNWKFSNETGLFQHFCVDLRGGNVNGSAGSRSK